MVAKENQSSSNAKESSQTHTHIPHGGGERDNNNKEEKSQI